jgi:hypothetical protein
MEDWENNLLKKVDFVYKNQNKLTEENKCIVTRIKAVLERGNTPSWRLHKQFTAIRVSLEDSLGGRPETKKTGLNYHILPRY